MDPTRDGMKAAASPKQCRQDGERWGWHSPESLWPCITSSPSIRRKPCEMPRYRLCNEDSHSAERKTTNLAVECRHPAATQSLAGQPETQARPWLKQAVKGIHGALPSRNVLPRHYSIEAHRAQHAESHPNSRVYFRFWDIIKIRTKESCHAERSRAK